MKKGLSDIVTAYCKRFFSSNATAPRPIKNPLICGGDIYFSLSIYLSCQPWLKGTNALLSVLSMFVSIWKSQNEKSTTVVFSFPLFFLSLPRKNNHLSEKNGRWVYIVPSHPAPSHSRMNLKKKFDCFDAKRSLLCIVIIYLNFICFCLILLSVCIIAFFCIWSLHFQFVLQTLFALPLTPTALRTEIDSQHSMVPRAVTPITCSKWDWKQIKEQSNVFSCFLLVATHCLTLWPDFS